MARPAVKLLLVLALLPVLPKGGVKRLEGVPVAAVEGISGAAVVGLAFGLKPANKLQAIVLPQKI